jgi:hypothetical protein
MPNIEKAIEPIFSKSFISKLGIAVRATGKIKTLSSDTDRALADSCLKDIKSLRKQVTEIRTSFTKPLDEKKAEVMALEKEVAKDVDAEVDRLTRLINGFIQQKHQEAQAEKARLQEEEQKRLKRLSSPTSIAKVQAETEQALAAVAAPTSGVRMVKKYEVVDLNLVPRELLMIDDAKVKELLKRGAEQCAGLRIYEEPIRSGR